jgi:serine/threonine protein kinase/predicted Zn-dependent protease
MTTKTPTSVRPPWPRIETAIEAFESEYRRAGTARIAAYLGKPTDPDYPEMVRELIRVDLELSRQYGRPKSLADYRFDFPATFASPGDLAAIAYEEYRLRRLAGDRVDATSYGRDWGIDVSAWERPGTASDASSFAAPTSVVPPEAVQLFHSFGGPSRPDVRFPEVGDRWLAFRLVSELGRGSFARVFLAEQVTMAHRPVVLKLSTQLAQESDTLSKLQHTNIVPIYSTHQLNGLHALCMPYFGATTLADVIRHLNKTSVPESASGIVSTIIDRKGGSTIGHDDPEKTARVPIPIVGGVPVPSPTESDPLEHIRHRSHVEACLWIAAELADGLAFAHARGIVHRDIKPANVLMSDHGRPMLLDFNLAADRSDLAAIAGTPSHMAPEQLALAAGESTAIDHRSDIYSLGLVLYELLTGQHPMPIPKLPSSERIAALRENRSKLPPFAGRRNPHVTPAIDAILSKCLAPNPEDRYASAEDLRDDLLRQLADRPLKHAGNPSWVERGRKLVRRNPWTKSLPVAVGAVAVAVVVAGSLLWSLNLERRRTQAERDAREFLTRAERIAPGLTLADIESGELAKRIGKSKAILETATAATIDRDLDDSLRNARRRAIVALSAATTHGLAVLADRTRDAELSRRHLATAESLIAAASPFASDERDRWLIERQARALRAARAGAASDPFESASAAPSVDAALFEVAGHFRHREWSRATARLATLEASASDRPDYWYARGRAAMESGNRSTAIAFFRTALALRPLDEIDIRTSLARAYLDAKADADAERTFDLCIARRPDDATLFVDRAIARYRQSDFAGADADLDRALELEPGHTRSWFIKRQVAQKRNDSPTAKRAIAEGLKREPGDEMSWVTRGSYRLAQGDAGGAIADFDAALLIDPQSRRALQNKASALSEKLEQPDKAIAVLDELIRLHPESTNARAGRGVLLARMGRHADAVRDAEATLRLDAAPFTLYQVAGIYALTANARPDNAAIAKSLLARAFRAGLDPALLTGDHDFDPLKADAEFQNLVAAARTLTSQSKKSP